MRLWCWLRHPLGIGLSEGVAGWDMHYYIECERCGR